jgi:hypothetical protein
LGDHREDKISLTRRLRVNHFVKSELADRGENRVNMTVRATNSG